MTPEALINARRSRGLTQDQMAKDVLGVSRKTLNNYENGRAIKGIPAAIEAKVLAWLGAVAPPKPDIDRHLRPGMHVDGRALFARVQKAIRPSPSRHPLCLLTPAELAPFLDPDIDHISVEVLRSPAYIVAVAHQKDKEAEFWLQLQAHMASKNAPTSREQPLSEQEAAEMAERMIRGDK